MLHLKKFIIAVLALVVSFSCAPVRADYVPAAEMFNPIYRPLRSLHGTVYRADVGQTYLDLAFYQHPRTHQIMWRAVYGLPFHGYMQNIMVPYTFGGEQVLRPNPDDFTLARGVAVAAPLSTNYRCESGQRSTAGQIRQAALQAGLVGDYTLAIPDDRANPRGVFQIMSAGDSFIGIMIPDRDKAEDATACIAFMGNGLQSDTAFEAMLPEDEPIVSMPLPALPESARAMKVTGLPREDLGFGQLKHPLQSRVPRQGAEAGP